MTESPMNTPGDTPEFQFCCRVLGLSLAADRNQRQRQARQKHVVYTFCLFAERSDVCALLRQLGAMDPPQSTGSFFSEHDVNRMQPARRLPRTHTSRPRRPVPFSQPLLVVQGTRQLAELAESEFRPSHQWTWNPGPGGQGYVRATADAMGRHYDVILELVSRFLWECRLGNI